MTRTIIVNKIIITLFNLNLSKFFKISSVFGISDFKSIAFNSSLVTNKLPFSKNMLLLSCTDCTFSKWYRHSSPLKTETALLLIKMLAVSAFEDPGLKKSPSIFLLDIDFNSFHFCVFFS